MAKISDEFRLETLSAGAKNRDMRAWIASTGDVCYLSTSANYPSSRNGYCSGLNDDSGSVRERKFRTAIDRFLNDVGTHRDHRKGNALISISA
jgi:hypothetical protein